MVLSAAGYCVAFSTSLISGASSVSGGSTNSSDTIHTKGVLGMKVLLQMVGGLTLRGAIVRGEKFPTPLMFRHPFPDVPQDAFLAHGQIF